MTEPIFDHEKLDVYRLSIEYLRTEESGPLFETMKAKLAVALLDLQLQRPHPGLAAEVAVLAVAEVAAAALGMPATVMAEINRCIAASSLW